MRIDCPCCGDRDSSEYVYLGAADLPRPDPSSNSATEEFCAYVYLRQNVAGVHAENWYHAYGCRSWLRVLRDTRTHEILDVRRTVGEAL